MSNIQTPELDVVSDRLVELAKYWLTEDNRFTAAGTSIMLPHACLPAYINTGSQSASCGLLQVTPYSAACIVSIAIELTTISSRCS